MKQQTGYTLVELMVVMSIMGIVGVSMFVMSRSFAQNQILKEGVAQTESIIRLAQSNSTASVQCNSAASTDWTINFDMNRQSLHLVCNYTSPPLQSIKTVILKDAQVQKIQGSAPCINDTFPASSFDLSFKSLTGKVSFIGIDECLLKSDSITITLKDLKSDLTQSIIVNKGGSVDVIN